MHFLMDVFIGGKLYIVPISEHVNQFLVFFGGITKLPTFDLKSLENILFIIQLFISMNT